MPTEKRLEKMERALRRRQPDLTVVAENIHDPHNVSAMMRSCEAVGIPRMHFLYTDEELPRIGKKSSASSNKWVKHSTYTSVVECYAELRRLGFRIYATRLDADAALLYDLDLTKPSAFVFGNEHRGVSDDAARGADERVTIPMMGMIQSLNVSVACAVTIFEAHRQRMRAGMYDRSHYKEDELRRLLDEWTSK